MAEEHKGGHGLYLILRGDLLVLVNVYLDYADFVAEFLFYLLKHGVHHLAWLTPRGEEVYKYEFIARYYVAESLCHIVFKCLFVLISH